MLGNQISLTNNVAKQVVSVTATQDQTDFTVQGGYRINQLGVYRNGVRLVDGRDYIARNGSSVTLVSQGANAGDAMEFVVFDDFRVADALSVNTGGTVNAAVNIKGSADQPTLTYDGSGILKVGDTAVELAIGRENANPFGSYLQARASNGAARDILLNPVGGDVGIGTDNPDSLLHIYNPITNTAAFFESGDTNCSVHLADSSGSVTLNTRDNGNLRIVTGGDSASPGTNATEKVVIDSSGDVGIGTDNPGYRLQVDGDVGINDSSESDLYFNVDYGNGTTSSAAIFSYPTRFGIKQGGNSRADNYIFYYYQDASTAAGDYLYLEVGDNERLRITGGGSVGIGTTNPSEKLSIGNASGSSYLNNTGIGVFKPHSLGLKNGVLVYSDAGYNSSASYRTAAFKAVGTAGHALAISDDAGSDGIGGTNNARINFDGSAYFASDVGVGTDSPPARVSGVIQSNVTKYLPSDYNENWAGAFINEQDGSTYNGVLIANRWRGTESIVLKVGSLFNSHAEFDPYFVVDGVGKIGIGTDVPESSVHIVSSSGNNANAPTKPGIHMGEGGTDDYHIQINSVTNTSNAYIDFGEAASPGVDYRARIIKTMGGDWTFNQTENAAIYFRTSGVNRMSIAGGGAVNVVGALSKGSGSFKIDHPLVGMSTTHNLVHSFIEGPQADLIYRGKVDLVGGSATVNIDTAGRMTEGTFDALCTNVQCFTSNETDWTAVKGSVSGNVLTITAQDNTSTATVSWIVVGERKDQHMIDTEWTDDNGRVITEPLKES